MYILLAEGVSAGEASPEEDEKIVVAAYTRKQLEQMMRTGKTKGREVHRRPAVLFFVPYKINN